MAAMPELLRGVDGVSQMVWKCERCGWEGEGDEGCGTHMCNPSPTMKALRELAERLARDQRELDASAKRILYENQRQLYRR